MNDTVAAKDPWYSTTSNASRAASSKFSCIQAWLFVELRLMFQNKTPCCDRDDGMGKNSEVKWAICLLLEPSGYIWNREADDGRKSVSKGLSGCSATSHCSW
jgi:hypothetical protein